MEILDTKIVASSLLTFAYGQWAFIVLSFHLMPFELVIDFRLAVFAVSAMADLATVVLCAAAAVIARCAEEKRA